MMRRPFRPLRPRIPGPGVRPAVPPIVRQALSRAQHLLQAGRFLEAAAIYNRLASEAYQRNRHRAGVQMDVETARAFLNGGDLAQAQARVRRAVRYIHELNLPAVPVFPLLEQICRQLESQGDVARAQAFREEILGLLPERPAPVSERAHTPQRKKLPGSCPACYAPLHPDELEWVADDRVSCPFCGTIVVPE
ncbi:MAG: hypothetical protein JXB35_08395 [Anaerolineae bacterium]|nr:hypothetical protein [Anaerolineae bacterium]